MKINVVPGANETYLPQILFLNDPAHRLRFDAMVNGITGISVIDNYKIQKLELIKTKMPGKPVNAALLEELYQQSLNGNDELTQGAWVFYPWLNKLVHILEKDEFIGLRTNRNHYKITPAEELALWGKTLGIIGLSVGHAVAVCIATERICGKIKLADFDTLELSNLNRIKTGIVNLGINKSIITAREIAEIDPFIEVECFTDGITENNLESFLLENGRLDILIDECDGLDIKIQCRQAAKKHGIPVVMETSDRGMLDVERFDLEQERPVLHGLLDGIPLDGLKNLTNEQKIPLILRIADVTRGSVRGKVSMLEVGQSISTWPQLASAVTLGGAVVTDVCRRILLDQYHESGRHYVDIESIASDKKSGQDANENPHSPFDINEALAYIEKFDEPAGASMPSSEEREQIIAFANMAPSTGNDQPWKWVFAKCSLFLFHDEFRSFSFGDFDKIASNLTFGAAYENLQLKAYESGYTIQSEIFPDEENQSLVARIVFYKNTGSAAGEKPYAPELVEAIPARVTNRNPSVAEAIAPDALRLLKEAAESVPGAVMHAITDREDILLLGSIIGECDRIRLLNPKGHTDFVHREMRWTPEHAMQSRDGIDIRTLGISGPLMAALSIMKDAEVSAVLNKINGGRALVDAAVRTVSTASMLGVITLPVYDKRHFFAGGISAERMWLRATQLGFAVHPLISPFYLFPRITKGHGEGLDENEIEKLSALRKQFSKVVPLNDEAAEVFIFKLATAPAPAIKTLRLPTEETMYVAK